MADDKDDFLDPAEFEALLNLSGASNAEKSEPVPDRPASGSAAAPQKSEPLSEAALDELLKQDNSTVDIPAGPRTVNQLPSRDVEAVFQSGGVNPARGAANGPEEMLERAAAGLDAALAIGMDSANKTSSPLAAAKPFEFQPFDRTAAADSAAELKSLRDVELDLRIELGRTELLIEEVLKLREGTVVPLDKLAGDPVDILVNGRLIARGEVLVLNDNFCVRVAEILAPALV